MPFPGNSFLGSFFKNVFPHMGRFGFGGSKASYLPTLAGRVKKRQTDVEKGKFTPTDENPFMSMSKGKSGFEKWGPIAGSLANTALQHILNQAAWRKTLPKNQVKYLKEAGLNPAMAYMQGVGAGVQSPEPAQVGGGNLGAQDSITNKRDYQRHNRDMKKLEVDINKAMTDWKVSSADYKSKARDYGVGNFWNERDYVERAINSAAQVLADFNNFKIKQLGDKDAKDIAMGEVWDAKMKGQLFDDYVEFNKAKRALMKSLGPMDGAKGAFYLLVMGFLNSLNK